MTSLLAELSSLTAVGRWSFLGKSGGAVGLKEWGCPGRFNDFVGVQWSPRLGDAAAMAGPAAELSAAAGRLDPITLPSMLLLLWLWWWWWEEEEERPLVIRSAMVGVLLPPPPPFRGLPGFSPFPTELKGSQASRRRIPGQLLKGQHETPNLLS